jgi:hypothetical protein
MVRDSRDRPPNGYIEQMSQQLHATIKKRIELNQKARSKPAQIRYW